MDDDRVMIETDLTEMLVRSTRMRVYCRVVESGLEERVVNIRGRQGRRLGGNQGGVPMAWVTYPLLREDAAREEEEEEEGEKHDIDMAPIRRVRRSRRVHDTKRDTLAHSTRRRR